MPALTYAHTRTYANAPPPIHTCALHTFYCTDGRVDNRERRKTDNGNLKRTPRWPNLSPHSLSNRIAYRQPSVSFPFSLTSLSLQRKSEARRNICKLNATPLGSRKTAHEQDRCTHHPMPHVESVVRPISRESGRHSYTGSRDWNPSLECKEAQTISETGAQAPYAI